MKRLIMLSSFLLLFAQLLLAQKHPYNVVFDVTSKDSVTQRSVVRWVTQILEGNPDAKLEVVMYGQGPELVVKERSLYAADVTKLAEKGNVSFRVCAVSMKHNNIKPEQLLQNVQTVPDGIYEIISKQAEGWGYIKVAH
jgi:hypothetical protein